jgi:hypothetical protein
MFKSWADLVRVAQLQQRHQPMGFDGALLGVQELEEAFNVVRSGVRVFKHNRDLRRRVLLGLQLFQLCIELRATQPQDNPMCWDLRLIKGSFLP